MVHFGVPRQSPYVSASALECMVGLVLIRTPTVSNVATVSFASEGAHHPTTMWISLEKDGYSHELVQQTSRFTFVVLHDGQRELAWACGLTSGRQHDKCRALQLFDYGSEFSFLSDGLTNTACRVRSSTDMGTHTLFVADLVGGDMTSRHLNRRHLLLSDLFE